LLLFSEEWIWNTIQSACTTREWKHFRTCWQWTIHW
jgi:hypothetical protein